MASEKKIPKIGSSFVSCSTLNRQKCIICQKTTKDSLCSTDKGVSEVRKAAEIRQDIVAERISKLEDDELFSYHMSNLCYKNYTHSTSLAKIKASMPARTSEGDAPDTEMTSPETNKRQTRSHSTPRAPPSSAKDDEVKYKIKCVVCGNLSHKKVYEKGRIEVIDRARSLIDAAIAFQDAVYTRIADLETPSSLIAADIYVHKLCINNYIKSYERTLSENEPTPSTPRPNIKPILFERAVPYIDQLLSEGKCCTLTELVEFLKSFLEVGEELSSELRTRDVRELLETHYGDKINLVPNSRVNESYFLYSSSINAELLALKIKNQNIMAEAGKMVRAELLKVNFGLQDSFCDKNDLKRSWEETTMPDCLMTFFGALFNIPKSKLFKQTIEDLEDVLDASDEIQETAEDEPWKRHHKSVKLHCFFQILAYTIHNGSMTTPFHSMVGHFLYSNNRSRSELTTFNRVGLSVGYNTLRSSRNLLANYAIEVSKDNVPIPSHFARGSFSQGAFDNADYKDISSLAGTDSKHYASMVLFQDATAKPSAKPLVSTTKARSKSFTASELPCQVVGPYRKPATRPSLPKDMLLTPENCSISHLDSGGARTRAMKLEFALHVVRTCLSEKPLLWTASRVLVTNANIPLMRVGFLPVIPKPITQPATVYKALQNFENVRMQMNQSVLPVWCDDGVFAPAMDIILSDPKQFKNIFLMLGPFHWTKVLLRCVGCLFAGSGIDDSLKECEVFGPLVLDSVINGKHYVRAMTGMLMIEDVIYRLMWEEFWRQHDKSSFASVSLALKVKEKFEEKKRCPSEFDELLKNVDQLLESFLSFKAECESKSEVCQFLGTWLQVASITKNAVAADREGNWDLHVSVVEDSLPVFAQFDCINYLRHGSWYAERIKVLEVSHPELYRRFSMGQWVVKDRSGWFNGIGCDMKLEQTIQRVSKGPGGHYVAGQSHKERTMAEYELLFHEIVAISNLFQTLTSKDSDNDRGDCNLGNSFAPTRNNLFNNNVIKLLDFIKQRSNPFSVEAPVPLHNIVTQQSYLPAVRKNVLNLLDNGKKVCQVFRKQRFVDKTHKMSATITKQTQPLLTFQPKATEISKEQEKIKPKDIALAQKYIEICKQRGMKMEEILTYDLLPQSPLFEGDLPAEPNKAMLVSEVEGMVDLSVWEKHSQLSTHIVVDFMSKVRQNNMSLFKTLGELCRSTISSSSHLCPQQLLHLVFDSYIEHSLKECERIRRTAVSPIDIIGMTADTLVPQQQDKFWASSVNKQNLQLLARKIVSELSDTNIMLSSVVIDDEILPTILHEKGSEEVVVQQLSNSWIEEADERLIIHVNWAVVDKHCERVIVLSNDADTFTLLLHYLPSLMQNGLKELWQQYGTGEKKRMIPLHDILQGLGEAFTKVILKAHVLTGDDSMSKIGTKHASLCNGEPMEQLSRFASEDILSEGTMKLAEEYLVRVWSGVRKTNAKTFDQLRYEYYSCYSQGIDGLPPTSSVIKCHIQRGAFSVKRKCSLINPADDGTVSYPQIAGRDNGWDMNSGICIPMKNLRFLPSLIISTCSCESGCSNNKCGCRREGLNCVVFCHGKKPIPCMNQPK